VNLHPSEVSSMTSRSPKSRASRARTRATPTATVVWWRVGR
jgi:hypothetical protein